MPSVPFVCIFPFFLSFFFLPFIPFSLFFSLYSRRYRFLVSTVWSKKPRLISHRASLGEGTTTMSNRKLLISGQHFPLFSLSLSLCVCLCLSVSFSLSLSLVDLSPVEQTSFRIRCKETLKRYVHLRISVPGFL